MTHFFVAPEEVVDLVTEMIHANAMHEPLTHARIGLLMRDEAPVSKGTQTLGKARKVTPEQRPHIPYDFVIWFAQDTWDELSLRQKCALVEHELCHCFLTMTKASIRPHDIDEFNYIIQKYGFWRPASGEWTERAVQTHFAFATGGVSAVDPSALRGNDKDIFEQLEDE